MAANKLSFLNTMLYTPALRMYALSFPRFNELLVSGQYKAAAIYAAHSPRGILRNTETMERFKGKTNPVLFVLPY